MEDMTKLLEDKMNADRYDKQNKLLEDKSNTNKITGRQNKH